MKKILSISLSLVFIAQLAQAQNFDRSIRPKAGPAPTINMGDAQSFTLPNGLRVFVVENHKLPSVSYQIDLDITPNLQGTSVGYQDMVGELMSSGTKLKSKDEFNKQVDALGGSISASSSGVYATSLTKQQDKLLALMSEMILQPKFTQAELEKLKTQSMSGLATQKDDPQAMSSNMIKSLIYGKGHAYGEVMTESTVKNITLDKCVKYYNTYYKPNAAFMAVVGDVTLEEAKALVTKYFGAWQKGIIPATKYTVPKNNNGTRVAVVNKTGAVQSVLNVTYPIALKTGTAEVLKARVANAILGGGSGGRLFQNLREGHGWTYGSYSSIDDDKYENSGTFSATAECQTESTDSSANAIIMEMNRMRNELVDTKTLENIKTNMAGKFALGLEDPKTLARYAINIQKYKMDPSYYKNYLKNLSAITANDVQDISKKYINPNNAIITVAGDKNEIAKKLAPLAASGKVEMYNMYGQPEVESAKSTASANLKAEDVIGAYAAAVGGFEKWVAIQDVTTKMELEAGPGQVLNVVEIKKAPSKYFQELTAQGQSFQKKVFDGTKGKESGMQGARDFDANDVAEMKEESFFLGEAAFLTPGYKLSMAGVEKLDGKDAYVVKVTKPNGKSEMYYYDVASKLKVKSSKSLEMGGQKATMTFTYSNYQLVKNGMKFPFTITQSVGPQKFNIAVKSIEINTGVADSVFEVK